ncbi:venom phosphodiesterase [Cyclopterus lumpus]|uniref:venom phosphodiesterase n=1 Tax=Cyclopterus lumpus TaxID=8103 RepID=UPI001485E5F1|nr:venom phosphodiesterase [Cyclopterus lumpus]
MPSERQSWTGTKLDRDQAGPGPSCLQIVPHSSCRGRCYEPYDGDVPGCRCDKNCNASSGSCCRDYDDICTVPTQQWECTKPRCGETRLEQSRCHCSPDCLAAADCCTNYKHVCHGEREWVEDECEDLSTPTCPAGFKQQPLLLVSLDGLRAEYLQTWSALIPVLDKLKKCGTSAPYMQAAFPSKTFPNHYTIVTGLYPESNGLIDNSMYDPVFNASFSLSSPEKDNPDWYLGQPIWHTAKHQGLKSGTFFWPGSDVKINGSFPDIYKPYNGKVPFEERVLTVLKWLQLPDDDRPDFYTLYLEEPDKSGHSYGPVSGGMIEAIQGVDKIIGQLMNGLKQIGLHRCLNIIIVADHGMEDTSCDRKEVLQELVGNVQNYWVSEGTFGRIRARNNAVCECKDLRRPPVTLHTDGWDSNGTKDCRSAGLQVFRSAGLQVFRSAGLQVCRSAGLQVFRRQASACVTPTSKVPCSEDAGRTRADIVDSAGLVANMTCKKPDQKVKAYLKADLPKRLHFANSRRIEDVNVLVEPKWLFERQKGSLSFCSGGAHGYDNDAESMHAMFVSYGPGFQYKTEIEPFSNIELYNLMCDVMQISPADNNGTHGSMNHLLRWPFYTPAPPAERSDPVQCPLVSLDPEDPLGCSCPSGNALNGRLNLTAEEESASEKKHMPFGRPRVLQPDQSYCVLHQEGFISGYSHAALMPLWSSFTVPKPRNVDPLPPVTADCLRPDVRLRPSQSPRCDQYDGAGNLTHAFLYSPELNETADQRFDALLMSNVVPMYPEFKKVWDFFLGSLLKKYASLHHGVNVVTGPAFDFNHDGQSDTREQLQQFVPGTNISVPTHFFAVLTSCSDSASPVSGCAGGLQTASFLLPHRPDNSESCKSTQAEAHWVEDLVWFHQSRVRDVEWITGLDFYQGSNRPIVDLLRMKTRPTAAIHRKQ